MCATAVPFEVVWEKDSRPAAGEFRFCFSSPFRLDFYMNEMTLRKQVTNLCVFQTEMLNENRDHEPNFSVHFVFGFF